MLTIQWLSRGLHRHNQSTATFHNWMIQHFKVLENRTQLWKMVTAKNEMGKKADSMTLQLQTPHKHYDKSSEQEKGIAITMTSFLLNLSTTVHTWPKNNNKTVHMSCFITSFTLDWLKPFTAANNKKYPWNTMNHYHICRNNHNHSIHNYFLTQRMKKTTQSAV